MLLYYIFLHPEHTCDECVSSDEIDHIPWTLTKNSAFSSKFSTEIEC